MHRKDVQKLNRKLASLNRYLVKISRKIVTIFQNLEKLHKKSDFQWTPEAEEAFKQMKKLIAELPTLTAPKEQLRSEDRLEMDTHPYKPRTAIKGQILLIYLDDRKKSHRTNIWRKPEGATEAVDIVHKKPRPCVDGSGQIEAKPDATATSSQVKKFVWDNIVCRFDLPGEIISDNGKQFRDNPFKDWCEKLCIRKCFAPETSSKQTLSSGQNRHCQPTSCTAEIDQAKNNEALGINLDLIEERREQAAIQEAKSKKKMEKYYNSRVRLKRLQTGRNGSTATGTSHAKDGVNLDPNRRDHIKYKEVLGNGSLQTKRPQRKYGQDKGNIV
ncbi:reverse transcriptase domain-containing protein [Tanacetum coccineum]